MLRRSMQQQSMLEDLHFCSTEGSNKERHRITVSSIQLHEDNLWREFHCSKHFELLLRMTNLLLRIKSSR